jgi:hypothetical protein
MWSRYVYREGKQNGRRESKRYSGYKGDTHGLFHGDSPFDGANMRKTSLAPFFAFVKVKNEKNLRESGKQGKNRSTVPDDERFRTEPPYRNAAIAIDAPLAVPS